MLVSGAVPAAQTAHFQGRLLVEWVDDAPFVPAMRLVETFSFHRHNGETWQAGAGALVDGRSLSPLFVKLMGHPFEGGFRKSAVVYDAAVKEMQRPWAEAQRMFFEAGITEGVSPGEAKVMYMLLYATGPRWVIREESTCFRNCHTGVTELVWRPLVDDDPVIALANWVRQESPSLQEIEQRVNDVMLHSGPHIFGYVR